jgi:ABC-type nitrate/sulfonate/bicarbonate transport system ATPase subunit
MQIYNEEDTIIYVENLSAGYDGKLIIKDVNILEKNITRPNHESTGQVIAILGRSGRGKSTLFKALTGLVKPIAGQILISDLATDARDDAKVVSEGDVGFVDQKYTLFRHKTVTQICQYALRKSVLSKDEQKSLIDNYISEWGLEEHRDKYPSELSGGQRQRTAIIEQLLSSKHFMILDEPAASLDIGNIEKLKLSFDKLLNDHEYNTILFSTHDINLAVEIADSIYILGHPEGTTEYSTIVKHYDLKAMGIAWTEYGPTHVNLLKDIKEVLLKS